MRPIVIGLLAFMFLAVSALAGSREDTLSAISRCASLPDDRTFLDCIYGAAQPMRARLGLAPVPTWQQRLLPPTTPALTHPPQPNAGPASSTPQTGILGIFNGGGLHTTTCSFDERGLFTVTRNDGTVWRQDAADTNFARFGGKASNYSVTLAAGGAGKNRMNVRGEPGSYLVQRMR